MARRTIHIYNYIENLQQTRLCGARSGSPQLVGMGYWYTFRVLEVMRAKRALS